MEQTIRGYDAAVAFSGFWVGIAGERCHLATSFLNYYLEWSDIPERQCGLSHSFDRPPSYEHVAPKIAEASVAFARAHYLFNRITVAVAKHAAV